jgi:hypothetical protein
MVLVVTSIAVSPSTPAVAVALQIKVEGILVVSAKFTFSPEQIVFNVGLVNTGLGLTVTASV